MKVSNIIISQLKTQLETLSGKPNLESVFFHINYVSEEFILTVFDGVKKIKLVKKVSDYSDLSDILIDKVNTAVKFNKIDVIELEINFNTMRQLTTVFGLNTVSKNVQITFDDIL